MAISGLSLVRTELLHFVVNSSRTVVLTVATLCAIAGAQVEPLINSVLDRRVAVFDLTDATVIDGFSKLSAEPISGLHLGVEEILRARWPDMPIPPVKFSLKLQSATVRGILDALCQHDNRYQWSVDGSTINVFPQDSLRDVTFFLNKKIPQIELTGVPNPEEALTPLARLLSDEQLGYAGAGGDSSYTQPWTTRFDDVTVRQFINRISEHIGPRGGWILNGSKEQRLFFFFNFGFY
jgi:hypothetical protein